MLAQMFGSKHPYRTIVLANALVTLAVFAGAFVGKSDRPVSGLAALHTFWDGPPYVVTAASLYDIDAEVWAHYGRPHGINWGAHNHAAHLIGYPAFVRLLAPIFGYFNSLLVATLLLSTLCFFMLYKILHDFRMVDEPLWITCAFTVFPFHWILSHALGASEPPFLLFILASFYFFRRRNLWLAGLFGGLAAITRIYGISLFPAYILALAFEHYRSASPALRWSAPWIRSLAVRLIKASVALSPIGLFLLAHFIFYYIQIGDFFAYFSQNGGAVDGVPFKMLVGPGGYGHLFLFMPLIFGLVWQWRQHNYDIFFLCLFMMLPTIFTNLADVGRFLVPVYPFLLFQPFQKLWSSRTAKIALVLCLPLFFTYVWSMLTRYNLPLHIYNGLESYFSSIGR